MQGKQTSLDGCPGHPCLDMLFACVPKKGNFENIKTPVFVELEERQYFAANTLSEVNNYWNFSELCKFAQKRILTKIESKFKLVYG